MIFGLVFFLLGCGGLELGLGFGLRGRMVLEGGGCGDGEDDEVEKDIDVRWRKPASEGDPDTWKSGY